VVQRSPFGIRLWRLLSHRRPAIGTSIEYMVAALAEQADVPRSELGAVVDGAEPAPEVVTRLGPALGFHRADMFVIAGLSVPRDLASAWPTSPLNVGSIIRHALRMGPRQLGQLNEVILSLPGEPRTDPAPADDYPEGPGSLLLRLARNRNIRPYSAQLLHLIGGGPYVSDSTIGMLGPGKTVITPQYVTAFAHLLGYAPDDMVALVGVGPVVVDAPVHPASADLAALTWNARLLSDAQLAHVVAVADEL
jgi:hypothetical protein